LNSCITFSTLPRPFFLDAVFFVAIRADSPWP
jgi:hypothetical protein